MVVDDNEYVQQNIKAHLVTFREAFNLFDTAGDGNVSTEDFLEAWHSFGFQASSKEVEETLAKANTDDDDGLSFHEFVYMITGQSLDVSLLVCGCFRFAFCKSVS